MKYLHVFLAVAHYHLCRSPSYTSICSMPLYVHICFAQSFVSQTFSICSMCLCCTVVCGAEFRDESGCGARSPALQSKTHKHLHHVSVSAYLWRTVVCVADVQHLQHVSVSAYLWHTVVCVAEFRDESGCGATSPVSQSFILKHLQHDRHMHRSF